DRELPYRRDRQDRQGDDRQDDERRARRGGEAHPRTGESPAPAGRRHGRRSDLQVPLILGFGAPAPAIFEERPAGEIDMGRSDRGVARASTLLRALALTAAAAAVFAVHPVRAETGGSPSAPAEAAKGGEGGHGGHKMGARAVPACLDP